MKKMTMLDDKLKLIRSEVATLELSRHAEEMQEAGEHQRKLTSRSNGTTSQDDVFRQFFDQLWIKVSEGQQCLRDLENAVKERDLSENEVKFLTNQHHEKTELLKSMQTQASWKPGLGKLRECPITQQDKALFDKQKLVSAFEEREITAHAVAKQFETMKSTADELSELNEQTSSTRKDLQMELEITKQEKRSVQDEIDGVLRLLKRKDKLFDSSVGRKHSEQLKVRDLESNKRVVQSKLQNHTEQIRVHENAIRHRAALLNRLVVRIEEIGDALSGSVSHQERVDVEVAEGIRKEIDILERESEENKSRLTALDGDIEDLESRIKTLEKATKLVEEEERRRRKDHHRFVCIANEQLEAQRNERANLLCGLEEEVEALRTLLP